MAQQLFTMAARDQAETIALRGLGFLASEPTQLERFLSETGLAPDEVRTNAGSREVLEAALTVLLNDEALLLTFAANANLAPEDIVNAHTCLATDGGRLHPETSS